MNNPLVSVIIPCYNHGKYLHECLNSVRQQTYKNIEIIIVNDGSTDEETNDIIKAIDEPGIYVFNKPNGGLAAARNSGIENSRGQIILPLDSDDYIGADYVKQAVEILMTDTKVCLVYCKGRYFGDENGIMTSRYESLRLQMLYNGIFCSALFRLEDFVHVGKYNTNMTNGYEDWDLWLRLIHFKSKVIQLSEIMFFYRKKKISMLGELTANITARKKMENTLFNNNINLYFEEYGSIIDVLREFETLKAQNHSINNAQSIIQNTLSYRLGHFILYPFKFIRKTFKK